MIRQARLTALGLISTPAAAAADASLESPSVESIVRAYGADQTEQESMAMHMAMRGCEACLTEPGSTISTDTPTAEPATDPSGTADMMQVDDPELPTTAAPRERRTRPRARRTTADQEITRTTATAAVAEPVVTAPVEHAVTDAEVARRLNLEDVHALRPTRSSRRR